MLNSMQLPNVVQTPTWLQRLQWVADPVGYLESAGQQYPDIFTEIFNYLDKTELTNNWLGVVLFPNRSVDTGYQERYTELLESQRVTRVYLDQLTAIEASSIGIETVKLILAPESTATTKAIEIVNTARTEIMDTVQQREIIELIETILIYKLPRLSREEMAKMFGLNDLKQTKFYQDVFTEGKVEGKVEGKIEGKLESVPRLVALGLSIEQIAQALGLEEAVVTKAAQLKS